VRLLGALEGADDVRASRRDPAVALPPPADFREHRRRDGRGIGRGAAERVPGIHIGGDASVFRRFDEPRRPGRKLAEDVGDADLLDRRVVAGLQRVGQSTADFAEVRTHRSGQSEDELQLSSSGLNVVRQR
jgi:hypothetical protein